MHIKAVVEMTFQPLTRNLITKERMCGVLWAPVCAVLLAAFAAKVANFPLFVRYVGTVTTFSGWPLYAISLFIVGLEALIPIASIFRPMFGRSTATASFLFGVFSVFHLIRILSGDPLPCSCFGVLLVMSPKSFLPFDLALGVSALAANRFALPQGRSESLTNAAPQKFRTVALLASICLLVLTEAKTVLGATKTQTAFYLRPISVNPKIFFQSEPYQSASGPDKRTIIVFGDYQCPFTQNLLHSDSWKLLQGRSNIQLQWREMPLNGIHPDAARLAQLSKWTLLKSGTERLSDLLKEDEQLRVAKALSLSTKSDQAKVLNLIEQDQEIESQMKLDHTPCVVIIKDQSVFEVGDLAQASKLLSAD